MDIVFFCIKALLYGTIGYYMFNALKRQENPFSGPISLFYLIFGYLASFMDGLSYTWMFILGITYGMVITIVLECIDKRMTLDINPCWFGLLNIFNVYVLEKLFNWFLCSSSLSSIAFLFIFGGSLFLIDAILTFRRII